MAACCLHAVTPARLLRSAPFFAGIARGAGWVPACPRGPPLGDSFVPPLQNSLPLPPVAPAPEAASRSIVLRPPSCAGWCAPCPSVPRGHTIRPGPPPHSLASAPPPAPACTPTLPSRHPRSPPMTLPTTPTRQGYCPSAAIHNSP